MSLHKLTAGSGYDYLTRQVAALDATDKGHTGLASYYTERGESPAVWVGSGMEGIDGLDVGDPVTAEQMRALFGCGLHPLAETRLQQLDGPNLTRQDFQEVMRLGAPFKIIDDATPFRVEVAKRIVAGEPVDVAVAAADRARIRTQVAREFFVAEHGRAPIDAAELATQIAKSSRSRAQTVAGFDLTFSPVKSVSTLWAVAEPAVAAVIERAHQAAVNEALRFIEQQALFTRTGPQGIRQVNVCGLVGAAFTHRDSRAGDPDLHTHVARRQAAPTPNTRSASERASRARPLIPSSWLGWRRAPHGPQRRVRFGAWRSTGRIRTLSSARSVSPTCSQAGCGLEGAFRRRHSANRGDRPVLAG